MTSAANITARYCTSQFRSSQCTRASHEKPFMTPRKLPPRESCKLASSTLPIPYGNWTLHLLDSSPTRHFAYCLDSSPTDMLILPTRLPE